MSIEEMIDENAKLTIIDDEYETDRCYYEIVVNKNFLNRIVFNQIANMSCGGKLKNKLTEREKEVLVHISRGKNNEEIAQEMHVSVHTVKLHLRNIFRKLESKDRTEAVVKAIRYNFININT